MVNYIAIGLMLLIIYMCLRKETFGSTGALVQLYAKGPQDLYLTPGVEKYFYWYHYNGYPYYMDYRFPHSYGRRRHKYPRYYYRYRFGPRYRYHKHHH